jgi:hypothetical protein
MIKNIEDIVDTYTSDQIETSIDKSDFIEENISLTTDIIHKDEKPIINNEKGYNLQIAMKPIKLGKDYKKSKLNFMNNFSNYLEYVNDNKKLANITKNVISKLFSWIDIFLINDLEDLVLIMFKRNKQHIDVQMHIFSYVENIFNERLYLILIEKCVKKKHNILVNSKNYLDNKDNAVFEEYIYKNTLIYIGIIHTEIFKMNVLKKMIENYLLCEMDLFPGIDLKNNLIKQLNVFYHKRQEYRTENMNKYLFVFSLFEIIQNCKIIIMYYYKDLKKNFSFCKIHIKDCDTMIIENKVFA